MERSGDRWLVPRTDCLRVVSGEADRLCLYSRQISDGFHLLVLSPHQSAMLYRRTPGIAWHRSRLQETRFELKAVRTSLPQIPLSNIRVESSDRALDL